MTDRLGEDAGGCRDGGGGGAKGVMCLVSAVMIHFCIGGIYAWSAFVPGLCEKYSLSLTQTQIVFGAVFGVFTTTTLAAGRLAKRIGPGWVGALGGVLFAAGYVMASVSGCSFGELFLYIGILSGLGTGLCYVVALASVIKWYPGRKGLATGLVVAGFGGGAIFLSHAAEMLAGWGMATHDVFMWIGIVYGLTIIGSARFLSNPDAVDSGCDGQTERPVRTSELLRDRRFVTIAAGMFGGTFAGLLIIGNMKTIGMWLGMGASTAMLGISAFSAGNAAGRILWGVLFDRYGARTIPVSILILAAGCAGLMTAKSGGVFLAAGAAAGFGFGACFVLYAAQIATIYGGSNVGSIYPSVFIFYGLSGVVAPLLGGFIKECTSSYACALGVCIIILAGIVGLTGTLGKGRH